MIFGHHFPPWREKCGFWSHPQKPKKKKKTPLAFPTAVFLISFPKASIFRLDTMVFLDPSSFSPLLLRIPPSSSPPPAVSDASVSQPADPLLNGTVPPGFSPSEAGRPFFHIRFLSTLSLQTTTGLHHSPPLCPFFRASRVRSVPHFPPLRFFAGSRHQWLLPVFVFPTMVSSLPPHPAGVPFLHCPPLAPGVLPLFAVFGVERVLLD